MFLRDVSSNVDVAPRGTKASGAAGLEPLVGTNNSASIHHASHEGESMTGKGGASAVRSNGATSTTTTTTTNPVPSSSSSSSSTRYPQGTTLYANRNAAFSRLSATDASGSTAIAGDSFGGKSASSFPLPSNYFSGAHSHTLSSMNASPPLPHPHSLPLHSSSTTAGMLHPNTHTTNNGGGPMSGMDRRSATTDATGAPTTTTSSSSSAAVAMSNYAAPRAWRMHSGGTLSPSAMTATGAYEKKKRSEDVAGGRPTSVPLPSSMLEGGGGGGGGSRGGSGGMVGSVFSPMEMGKERGKGSTGGGGSGMAPPPPPAPSSKGLLPPSASHGTSQYDAFESAGKRSTVRDTRVMGVASGTGKTASWIGRNQSSSHSRGTSYPKNGMATTLHHTMVNTANNNTNMTMGMAEPVGRAAMHTTTTTTTPAEFAASHLHSRTFTSAQTLHSNAPSTTTETRERTDSPNRGIRVEGKGSYPLATSSSSSSATAAAVAQSQSQYLSRAKPVPSSSVTTTMATSTTTTTNSSSSMSFSSSINSTDSSSSPQISYGSSGGSHPTMHMGSSPASSATSPSVPMTGVSLDRYLRTIPYCPRLIDDITKTFLLRERTAVREFTDGMAPHNSHRPMNGSALSDLHRYYAAPHYLQYHPDITPRMRVILIDWVVGVHKLFRHYRETLFLCINIFDRYLSVVNTKYKPFRGISRSKLQLVAVSAYLIAMKYEELVVVELKELVSIVANVYTKEEIIETEMKICTALGFRLVVPTSYQFSMRLLIVLEGSHLIRDAPKPHRCMEQLFHLTNFFLEHALLDYNALQFTPSQVGNAAVFLAIHTLQHNMWIQKERQRLENPATSASTIPGLGTSTSGTSRPWAGGSSAANGESGQPSRASRSNRGDGMGGGGGDEGGSMEREEERASVGGGVPPRQCLEERDANQYHHSSYKKSEEGEEVEASHPGSPTGRRSNSNQMIDRGGAAMPSLPSLNSSAMPTHSTPVWTTALRQVSESNAEDFLCCSDGMLHYVETIRGSKYQTVRDKYTSSRFGEVCKLIMPPCLPLQ